MGLPWKMLVYFMTVWSVYGHLIYFMAIWYIFPVLVYCLKKNLAILAIIAELFFPLSKKIVDGDKFFSPVKKITCSYERRFVMEINSHKQPKDLEKKMRRMIYLRHSQFDAG
jgi:hypothetical protein